MYGTFGGYFRNRDKDQDLRELTTIPREEDGTYNRPL
jgi:hypothetical protein